MSTHQDNQFSGKVAIVTGSSSGIGEEIALTFARRGAKVTISGRDVTRVENVREKCIVASGGHADRFLGLAGDLTDAEYRSRLVKDTVAKFGQLDILICNAGILVGQDNIREATETSFDQIVSINLKSVFFMIQTALPELERSKGNIVATSSTVSRQACSPFLLYPMTKAGLDHLVNCLALDLAPLGIRVNSVHPSYTETRILTGQAHEDFKALEAPQTPLGNRLVTVQEVAQAVAFLSSNEASFITGQHLFNDGGRAANGPCILGPPSKD